MRELIDDLNHIKLAIFDLDGVVYRGKQLIPESDTVIKDLKDLSIKVIYNSNNSTATRQMYVKRLENFGIKTKISDFYTSASITAAEITKIKENATIFVIGEIGLKEELKAKGHNIISHPENYNNVDFVIAGLDREFNYNTLAIAQKYIMEGGADFYATNPDATLPVADGFLPGAGVMVNAIETCTGHKPIKIFGKPEPFGIELILKDLQIPAKKACIFGDRLNTDIAAGNKAGIMTICVLTGVTTKKMIEDIKKQGNHKSAEQYFLPNLTIHSLSEIFKK